MTANYPLVDSVESFEKALAQVRAAQKTFATYTQEQVDHIFQAAAIAAQQARIPLAKMAVQETGMGVVEDKIIKNQYAAEYIYNAYKDTKTCGVIEQDDNYGITRIAEPIGVIAAVIPPPHPPPHLHRHLQNADCPEDPQRHHHQPPSPGQGLHHRRGEDRAGGRGEGRRPRGHHQLD